MKLKEVIKLLRDRVKVAGTQAAAAEKLGVSKSFLSEVLSGEREPGDKLLTALGLEERKTYEKARR